MVVYLGSPAHLLITDPLGNKTGWDSINQSFVKEIPYSNYLDERIESIEPFWVAYVEQPLPGLHEIQVVGTGDGLFTVEVISMDSGYSANRVHRFKGTITDGRKYSYGVNYSPVPESVTTIEATTYIFSGFKPPLTQDYLQIFKLNRTIPIKFQVTRNDGGAHDDILARVAIQQIDNNVPVGEPIEPEASGEANTDDYFRYDPAADQYVYNLSTKNLHFGTWKTTVTFDDGSTQTIEFGLK